MTTFILACVGLVLLSGLFYLFPRVRPGSTEADLDSANLEWFRLRRLELTAEGNDALDEDARLRLLEDEHRRGPSQVTSAQSFPVWILLPLVALLAGVLYYMLGAVQDVEIAAQLQNLQEDISPAERASLIASVEARSLQRPENLHYISLLGRYYMGQEQYARAAEFYAALVQAVPEDAQALAYAAQSEYLAADRKLSPLGRLRAEQALAADPQQRTALGLLGMAAFDEQQYDVSIGYWTRLLALESSNSDSRQMIEQLLAASRQQLAASGTEGSAPPAEAAPASTMASSAGVTVSVSAPAGAIIDPADTVFILARNADSQSRMPIAVQRLTGAQLPVTLRLDDGNSMAGQKLSVISSVIVAVQVSPDGRPGEANARWLGQAGPVSPSVEGSPVSIVLAPNAP